MVNQLFLQKFCTRNSENATKKKKIIDVHPISKKSTFFLLIEESHKFFLVNVKSTKNAEN